MSPERRFAWWVVAVVVWAAAAPLRLGGYDAGWTAACAIQTGAVVLMFALLATTPPEAIRLRGPVSWTILMAGVWLNLVCAVSVLNNATLFAALVLAVLVPVGAWSTAIEPRASVWWAVLVAWSPALPALVARRVRGESAIVIGASWSLAGVGLAVALSLVWFQSRQAVRCLDTGPGSPEPEWRAAAWILGIAAALSGVVPWLS